MLDWQGRPYDPANGPAAHPNSRFTVQARQNPAYSKLADAPGGVPISAIVFGGRRRSLAPLVYQARNWPHGVLMGAGLASETTAAATGAVGVVRRDPMAMKPFAGYDFGDYWAHWLNVGAKLTVAAGDLSRQLVPPGRRGQILVAGLRRQSARTALDHRSQQGQHSCARHGHRLPAAAADLDTRDLDIAPAALEELLAVSPPDWHTEFEQIGSLSGGVRRAGAGGAAGGARATRSPAREPDSLLADVADDLRGVAVRRLAEADQPLAANLHRVAAHEGFLAILAEHERAVGALIDQHELVAIELDARVQAAKSNCP